MLVATSNEEVLILAERECQYWLVKFVLTDLFFILPFPNEEPTIIEVSKRDKVNGIWRKS